MDQFKKIDLTRVLPLVLLGALSASPSRAQSPSQGAQHLRTQSFKVCGLSLKLEIAETEAQRSTGLMYRNAVPKETGMLFVFGKAEILNFWMRNVPFDIDIGYFDSSGKLLTSMTMKGTSPLMRDEALPRYSSRKAARYAIEAESGFFSKVPTKDCRLSPLP